MPIEWLIQLDIISVHPIFAFHGQGSPFFMGLKIRFGFLNELYFNGHNLNLPLWRDGCLICVQVQIGSHAFTFDYVFGGAGSPSSTIFDQCVAPLVESLFHGYNATVLAYGQVRHLI